MGQNERQRSPFYHQEQRLKSLIGFNASDNPENTPEGLWRAGRLLVELENRMHTDTFQPADVYNASLVAAKLVKEQRLRMGGVVLQQIVDPNECERSKQIRLDLKNDCLQENIFYRLKAELYLADIKLGVNISLEVLEAVLKKFPLYLIPQPCAVDAN